MAIQYSTAAKTARMTGVRDTIDGGSGAGKLVFYTAGYASVLGTVTLNDPCGTVTDGVLTFSGFPKTQNASANGTAAVAQLLTSSDTVVVTGITVGVTGADILVVSTTFTSGIGFTINSLKIYHAT